MNTRTLLLVAVAVAVGVVAASAGRATAASAVGLWEEIRNVDDPKIQELGRWAVVAANKRAGAPTNDALTFNRVYGAEKQVVAGLSYRLHLEASSGGGAISARYVAEVYQQEAAANTRELVSFQPTH
ncbi:hypothetical protein GUJ93_ZPchr0006g40658 [Zizania palustris]|uniref:Cystatin domain-containing protein n=1 Tax=Zizania palustris TaxID=103762 RepID=A0A8J5W3T8_ZIZPA|nr:hypothetical protein GUJ93_ZPchr0006g40658 [Zizania palustris]